MAPRGTLRPSGRGGRFRNRSLPPRLVRRRVGRDRSGQEQGGAGMDPQALTEMVVRLHEILDQVETGHGAARGDGGGTDPERTRVSRRALLTGALAVAAAGATLSGAAKPAQAAMAVFDAANLAKAVEHLNTAVKQVEMLTDLARLDELALKALGQIGAGGELAGKLFGMADSVTSAIGAVQRLRNVPARLSDNLSTSSTRFRRMGESLKTFDGARGVYKEIYGSDGSDYGPRERRDVELIRADTARQALIDAMALATSEREATSKSEDRIKELAKAARDTSGAGDNASLRAQVAASTSVQLAIFEQLTIMTALQATDVQARSQTTLAKAGIAFEGPATTGSDAAAEEPFSLRPPGTPN